MDASTELDVNPSSDSAALLDFSDELSREQAHHHQHDSSDDDDDDDEEDEEASPATQRALHAQLQEFPSSVEDVFEHARLRSSRLRPRQVHLKTYWRVLLLIGVFYALPSIQFVLWQYWKDSPSDGVFCYFNYKCARPFLGFHAFNNILSNVGYIVGGIFFLLFVFFTRVPKARASAKVEGLHTDMSLYNCLGICTVYEGIFSALYHVCPSKVNFQFDVTFMILGGTFLFYTLFQKRHPLSIPGAIRTFGALALIIFTSFLALTDIPLVIFWVWVCILMYSIMIPMSLQLYYAKRMPITFYVLPKRDCLWPIARPFRLAAILTGNLVTLAMLMFSCHQSLQSGHTSNFPTFVVGVIILNTFVYLVTYLLSKIYNGEKIHWIIYILFVMFTTLWAFAIYYFVNGPTDKFLTPAESAKLNQPCYLFDYFDRHDVWHFLSAGGLVTWGLLVYLLDRDTRQIERAKLAVF